MNIFRKTAETAGRFLSSETGWKLRFIVLAGLIAQFYFVYADSNISHRGRDYEADSVIGLSEGVELKQEIAHQFAGMDVIRVAFRRQESENGGIVHVRLSEDDRLIQSWDVKAEELDDNSYEPFFLNQAVRFEPGSHYVLSISETGGGEQPVQVCLTEEAEEYFKAEQILPDAEGMSVCYVLSFENHAGRRKALLIGDLCFILLACGICLIREKRIIMCLMLVFLGGMYLWAMPNASTPDEPEHFCRAFEISEGHLLSARLDESGYGGNFLPGGITDMEHPDAVLDFEHRELIGFPNLSLYSPVCYAPHAAEIRIGCLVSDRVSTVYYAGRISHFLVCAILCIYALLTIPFGSKILFAILVNPMTLQEMTSMSPDGITIAIACALCAAVMNAAYADKALKNRQLFFIAFLCAVLSQCKIVYVVLAALVLLIPDNRIGSHRKAAIVKAGILLSALLLNLVWLRISADYLVGIEFRPGVNAAEQVLYIRNHPLIYCSVIIRTILDGAAQMIGSMLGTAMGIYDIPVSGIVWCSFFGILAYTAFTERNVSERAGKTDQRILLLTAVSCILLICTSLYIQWTEVGGDTIDGIQGRYFLPVLPVILLLISLRWNETERKNGNMHTFHLQPSYLLVILMTLDGIALIDICHHFGTL